MAEFDISKATREAVIILEREIAGQPEWDSQGGMHFPGLEDGQWKLLPRQDGIARFERSELGTIYESGKVPPFSIPASAIVFRSEDDKWFYLLDTETLLSMLPIRQPVPTMEDLPHDEACEEKAGLLRFVVKEGIYYQVEKGENSWMWQPVCPCGGVENIEECDVTIIRRGQLNVEDCYVTVTKPC